MRLLQESNHGWAGYRLLRPFKTKDFTSRYSFKNIIFRLQDVRVSKINDILRMTKITKSTVSLREKLVVEFEIPKGIGAP
jgi:hypothetical protein